MRALFFLLATGLGAVVACSVADMPGANRAGVSGDGKATGRTTEAVACSSPKLVPKDPSKLPTCECKSGGKARCVKTAELPAQLSSQLEKCDDDDGACVPDTIVTSGEKAIKSCKDKGKEGRCLSMCVPLVAKYASAYLTRGDGDACPSDERCVPCENPLDGTRTGVCEIGNGPPASCHADAGAGGGIAVAPNEPLSCPFAGAPADVSRFSACGPDNGGRCIDDKLVSDPRIATRLETCAGGLCVPEVYVKEKGQHLPAACMSFAGIEGRCFSMVFKDVSAQKDFLDQNSCAPTERCVPCFNPATGEPSGACSTVSCDAPKTAAPKLKDCCRVNKASRGKCIPTQDVPEQFRSRLSSHECDSASELCAPTDNLDPTVTPVQCAATTGRGVCVSNCVELDFVESIILDRGSCRSDQTCVPCTDPSGQPTGAPGCG